MGREAKPVIGGTPGPWIVERNHVVPDFAAHRDANSDDEGRHSIAVLYGPDAEANAPLVAAAPDLLAAIKAVEFGALGGRRCAACAGWNVGPNGETDHAHTKDCPVALAIAKAEGR